ncbi:MAG: PAS domain S-box protein [Verrucomicrobium sp.]|nr:PAS domain S-box protein [Verrucomicrobium sp.]
MKSLRKYLPLPLHASLPLSVLICCLIFIAVNTSVLLKLGDSKELKDQALLGGKQVARLARVAARAEPEKSQQLNSHLEILSSYSRVKWAGICDGAGKFVACTNASWVGQTVKQVTTEGAGNLVARTLDSREPHKERVSSTALVMTYPVNPDLESISYRVAILERDMLDVLAGQRQNTIWEAGASAIALLVICALYWWWLQRFLRNRMNMVLDLIRSRHHSIGPVDILPGADEFSRLSAALHEQEALFRQIVDNINEVVWVLDGNRQVIYISPAYERVWGRDREGTVRGNPLWNQFIPQEHLQKLKVLFETLYSEGKPVHFEYPVIRKDGERGWIEASALPVRSPSGQIHRVVGISRDVTDRKMLEEQFLQISEQERQRLGHDLHDDACQRLASLKMRCEVLVASLRTEQSPSLPLAQELKSQLSGTSALLRDIARGLSPVEMDGEGLMLALRKLVGLAETIYEVPCFFECEQTVLVSNTDAANHIYRIAQEFINNAARHGHPSRIDMVMETDWESVSLTVTNDGVPFKEPTGESSGMGLKIIRYRANAIGAFVSIRPRNHPDGGTIAECIVSQNVCNPEEGKPGGALKSAVVGSREG